jgi:hypothetical protein
MKWSLFLAVVVGGIFSMMFSGDLAALFVGDYIGK